MTVISESRPHRIAMERILFVAGLPLFAVGAATSVPVLTIAGMLAGLVALLFYFRRNRPDATTVEASVPLAPLALAKWFVGSLISGVAFSLLWQWITSSG